MSSHPFMVNFRQVMRSVIFGLSLLLCMAAAIPAAYGQFTLTPTPFLPTSVDPGGSATATITLTTAAGFTGSVDLTCTVTSSQVTTSLPGCLISPASESASSTPSLTVTTTGSTLAGTYQITVTGTDATTATTATAGLSLSVANLAQDFVITVFPTIAVPSPVVAGSVATTVVTVSPLGSYSGTVTLSCLSVSPVVAGAPTCSFNPPHVAVAGGTPPTSTLTITSYGIYTNQSPTGTSKLSSHPRVFYALWLALPAITFVGLGLSGKRHRKLMGFFLLMAVASALVLLPACGSNTPTQINTNINQVTPNNTYTFTVTGTDTKGIGPGSTTSAVVTLQVTAE